MKQLKELKFEELTLEQKLGMVHTAMLHGNFDDEAMEYIYDMVRNHALGSVWIQFTQMDAQKCVDKIREIADYPILIFTDAENGMGEFMVGRHNSIGCTGDERYAYAFGKAVGITARNMGYSVVCDPVLDVSTTGWVRSLGSDKEKVARMAAAEARGLHDGGVLTVGKHYPSGRNPLDMDSHMAEAYEDQTEEDLVDYSLYAYIKLINEGLLDGLMSSHHRFINIDPNFPASLSKIMLDVIRRRGFNGFFITDALDMMGIRAKYGDVESKGMAVEAGNDFVLPYNKNPKENQEAINYCFEKGILTEERLNEAVKRILAAQHKYLMMEETRATELSDEELYLVKHINKDSVFAQTDDGVPVSISRDGKHLFALMTRMEESVGMDGAVELDTFNNGWHYPTKITAKIKELFPNSTVYAFHQFPKQGHNMHLLSDYLDHEDIIFVTFSEAEPFAGREHLTRRVETLIHAAQSTGRVSTLIHCGNPCILGNLPHIPRCIFGGISEESMDTCLDILAGEYEAKGTPTYDFKLN